MSGKFRSIHFIKQKIILCSATSFIGNTMLSCRHNDTATSMFQVYSCLKSLKIAVSETQIRDSFININPQRTLPIQAMTQAPNSQFDKSTRWGKFLMYGFHTSHTLQIGMIHITFSDRLTPASQITLHTDLRHDFYLR